MVVSPSHSPVSLPCKKNERLLTFVENSPLLKGLIQTVRSINSVSVGETGCKGAGSIEIVLEQNLSKNMQKKTNKI